MNMTMDLLESKAMPKFRQSKVGFMSPLRGFGGEIDCVTKFPTAHAVGFIMPPLRGCTCALQRSFSELKFSLRAGPNRLFAYD